MAGGSATAGERRCGGGRDDASTFAFPRTRTLALVKKKKKKRGWSDCSHQPWLHEPSLGVRRACSYYTHLAHTAPESL